MQSDLDLSIIIVSWNTREMLAECIQSLYTHTHDLAFDIWVVDNGSTDGSQSMLRERFPQVHLIANTENVGFARANNQGIEASCGRYILLFNSDAFSIPGTVNELVQVAEAHPKAGIVGSLLLNIDGSFQYSHTPFPTLWSEWMILSGLGRLVVGHWYPSHGPDIERGPQQTDYVGGACLLARRAAIQQVGGMDEGYFMYAEEVDWCYTMKQAGWEVWYQPASAVLHKGGGSSQSRKPQREADMYRSRVRFFRKHYGNFQALALKALIYTLTSIKIVWHRTVRALSHNRRGRPIMGMEMLVSTLRDI